VKTLWHLIYEWRKTRSEAARLKSLAEEAWRKAAEFEDTLRPLLDQHGPVLDGHVLYRAPPDPRQPIVEENVTEALYIPLEGEAS